MDLIITIAIAFSGLLAVLFVIVAVAIIIMPPRDPRPFNHLEERHDRDNAKTLWARSMPGGLQ